MGAQQGKEVGPGSGGRVAGGQMSPHPHHHHHQQLPQHPQHPPVAGRLGERQGSRIKGLRQPKQRNAGNIFTEHSGEYLLLLLTIDVPHVNPRQANYDDDLVSMKKSLNLEVSVCEESLWSDYPSTS